MVKKSISYLTGLLNAAKDSALFKEYKLRRINYWYTILKAFGKMTDIIRRETKPFVTFYSILYPPLLMVRDNLK